MIHINEMFWSIQGEGFNSGRRALFVRMPYCNLDCEWCDTNHQSFDKVDEEYFIRFIKQEPSKFAVITGGEPTLHKHTPDVIKILKGYGFYIAMETNGTQPIPPGVDWVSVSPKRQTNYLILPEVLLEANEVKFVVDKGFQFDNIPPLPDYVHKYLSPEFGNFKNAIQRIAVLVMLHPEWRVSLQTHKWMGVQ